MAEQQINCLDYGFVRYVDHMGDDSAIVDAARVSYGTGTKALHEDRGLIRYLMRRWHTTPFEMVEFKFHCKMPLFVARQWIRHRTANVNEYSARYSILDREFYIPEQQHIAEQSTTNKQGRGEELPTEDASIIQDYLINNSNQAYDLYERLADPDKFGLARELARVALPVNFYTQWYWKIDLHNLFHFLRLRCDPHAQYEIRVYADAICEIIKPYVPLAFEAFEDYRLNAEQFSAAEMKALRKSIHELVPAEQCAAEFLKGRELNEFLIKLELIND